MKIRFFSAALALLLCLLLSCTALAAEPTESEAPPYATAAELYESWYQQNPGVNFPYPEFVNGVWSVDGTMHRLCFSLVKGTPEARREELLALIADKESLCFVEGSSRTIRELVTIQDEITARMGPDAGIYVVGVNEGAGTVSVGADPEVLGALREELRERYGDAVSVYASSPIVLTDDTMTVVVQDGDKLAAPLGPVLPQSPDRSGSPWLWAAFAAGAALLAGAVLLLLRRRRRLCPAEGEANAPAPRWTKRRVAAELRESSAAPPPELQDKLLEAAKKLP